VGAVKAIRSMRLWAYETFKSHEVLHLVCMPTPDDIAANAECVRCELYVVHARVAIDGGRARSTCSPRRHRRDAISTRLTNADVDAPR